jgi:hypothetical protein
MGQRAAAFADGIRPALLPTLHYRHGSRARAMSSYVRALLAARPDVIYVLDLTLPAVMAAYVVRRLTGCRVVIDTGDATADLICGHHTAGRLARPVLTRYERRALRSANAVVVRGTCHRDHLADLGLRQVTVIPDGVNMDVFRPGVASELRVTLGLERRLTVGVVGSLHWNERLQWTTGMELVEAIAAVRSDEVIGLVVGQGSGMKRLRAKAEALGVAARIRFVDQWLDSSRLAAHIGCMDLCLSTQTNNLIGQVRTTGKLPLFLAADKFVVATRVGEAARVLPDPMLVDYDGDFDPQYPGRLAERIDSVRRDPHVLSLQGSSRRIAAAEFDYRILMPRVRHVLDTVLDTMI